MSNYILKDIAAIREYVTVGNAMDFALWTPHLALATRRYLKPIMGAEELDALIVAYNAPSLSATQTIILPYAQACAAHYMVLLALPTQLLKLSNMGLHEVAGKDGLTSSPRQWTYETAVAHFVQAADEAAEELLQAMEQNKGGLAYWDSSDEWDVLHKLLLNDSTQLAQFIDVRGSRRVYAALRPIIKNFTERQHVLPWIGPAQYTALQVAIRYGPMTGDQTQLLNRCQRVIAYHGLVMLSNTASIWLTGDGLRMPSTGNFSSGISTKAADLELRSAFRQQMQEMAAAATTELQHYILDNIALYPLIEASEANPVVKPRQPYEFRDQSSQTSFMV